MSINNPTRKMIGFGLCFSMLLLAFLLLGYGYFLISPIKKEGAYQSFTIREGLTLRQIAYELESQGLIRSKNLFLIWARLKGYGKNIKAGEYRLSTGMNPLMILNRITEGRIITHPVTIPEGFRISQIGDLLDREGVVDKQAFYALASDPETAKKYQIPAPNLEGYLYPDTYYFGKNTSAADVIQVMVTRFWEVIGPLRGRIESSGLTLSEVVTLASIVEKETGRAEERPVIASVFLNRLNRNMRLETDPTVIYGLENFDGNLKKKHLKEKSPYNTYVIRGLPPGPIANSGLEAIRAVLYPAETEFLYFVSKNDGTHHFSKTLTEHNRAVQKYQKKKRRRKRKQTWHDTTRIVMLNKDLYEKLNENQKMPWMDLGWRHAPCEQSAAARS
jgi:UPF0755 protein